MIKRPPFTFMIHALDRYIERFSPGTPRPLATRMLSDASLRATRRRRNTRTGEEVWTLEVDSKRVDCVVKRDGPGRGRAVCVTVMPEGTADGYVHEQRVSQSSAVADPASEALRIAVRYAMAAAQRGEARAIRVVEELTALAPWVVRGSFTGAAASFGAAVGDNDGGVAMCGATGTDGGEG